VIATQFDEHLREVPKDPDAYDKACLKNAKNLDCAAKALENATELDKIDYYRALSRSADLHRFSFRYEEAGSLFSEVSIFWRSIGWGKAAFLCDLKAELCSGYVREKYDNRGFDFLLSTLNESAELQVYLPFYHQYRGQILAFCGDNEGARIELSKSTRKELESKLSN